MWTKEKVEKKIKELSNDIDYTIYNFEFIIDEKPEQYVRERAGRGKHFYNPKGSIVERYKKTMKEQLGKENRKIMNELFDSEKQYTVSVECDFYIPIPKNDSVVMAAKKEKKIVLPNKRPDLDNYGKLLLDALHDVVYKDDAVVCKLTSQKFYSIHPRTEIRTTIKIED